MKYKIEKALQEQYEDNRIRVVAIVGNAIIVHFDKEIHIIRCYRVMTPLKKQVKCDGYVAELIGVMNVINSGSSCGGSKGVLWNDSDEYIVVDGALYRMEADIVVSSMSTDQENFLGGEFIC